MFVDLTHLENFRRNADKSQELVFEPSEIIHIPSNSPYVVRLSEVPDNGSVAARPLIAGFTEVYDSTFGYIHPSNPNEFQVNYQTGDIIFPIYNADETVSVAYWKKGSFVDANHINSLVNALNSANFSFADHTHDITNFDSTIMWSDITDIPDSFPPSIHQHDQTDITNVPDFTDVDSVLQDDITGKPDTFPPSDHTHDDLDIVMWDDITNKPDTFPPSFHQHDQTDVTNTPSIDNDLTRVGNDLIFNGNLIPSEDSTQNIGSPEKKIKELHVSANTIFLGTDTKIKGTSLVIDSTDATTLAETPTIVASSLVAKPFKYNPGSGLITVRPSIAFQDTSGNTYPISFDTVKFEFSLDDNEGNYGEGSLICKNITVQGLAKFANFLAQSDVSVAGNLKVNGNTQLGLDKSSIVTICGTTVVQAPITFDDTATLGDGNDEIKVDCGMAHDFLVTAKNMQFDSSGNLHIIGTISANGYSGLPAQVNSDWDATGGVAQIFNKPSTFPPSNHTQDQTTIINKPLVYPPSDHTHDRTDLDFTVDWSDVLEKPITFQPSNHEHDWTDISNTPETYTPSAHIHDHGTDLTGLADDDHTQYHNNSRGDERYSLLSHNHDYSDSIDLALDKTATASNVQGGYPPNYANDGNAGTYWGAGGAAPQQQKVDLGSQKSFGFIRWANNSSAYTYIGQIKVSNNDTDQTSIITFDTNGYSDITYRGNWSGRYIKWDVSSSSGGYLGWVSTSIFEVKYTGLTGMPIRHGSLTDLTADDHTQYFNQSRGDARYSQLDHTHTDETVDQTDVYNKPLTFTPTAHIHDHGTDLTGLGDDDHTQYLNETRGDARYSLIDHTQDQTSIINKPTTFTPSAHNQDQSTITNPPSTYTPSAHIHDHGTDLTGLGDDDHTQYVLLSGRTNGQTIYGGHTAGKSLTLKSTSDATKGYIYLGSNSIFDEINDRLGIGTLAPGNYNQGKCAIRGSYNEISGGNGGSGSLLSLLTNTAPGAGGIGGTLVLGGRTGNTVDDYVFAAFKGAKSTAGGDGNYDGHLRVYATNTVGSLLEVMRIGDLNTTFQCKIIGQGTGTGTYGLIVRDYGESNNNMYTRDDGMGYLRAASWTYGSDIRLKENISLLGYGLDKIMSLQPKKFDYITGEKNQFGFIAQDVEEVIPELIEETMDGILGLKSNGIVPILVNAIKEQQVEIESLQSQLTTANDKISKLEDEIAAIKAKLNM